MIPVHLLLLAAAPFMAAAKSLAEWQQPLPKHPGASKCGRGRRGLHYGSAFSLQMNGDWRYYFNDYFPGDWQCWRGDLTHLDMGVLDDMSNHIAPAGPPSDSHSKKKKKSKTKRKAVSLMLTIPHDTESEGTLVVEPEPEWKLFHQMDKSIDILWTASKNPGRDLNMTSVGVRQGPTIISKTGHAFFVLDTPFINLPNDIYDRVSMVARPQRIEMGRGIRAIDVVECNATSLFPNLVLNFGAGEEVILVKPSQYVLNVNDALGGPFAGKCVLLLTRSGEPAIGWAALRGRTVWLDWANARTGITK